ncbi:MAG: hypothetical protein CMC15_16000 [Flavobacteriaceae bacterium]|jgi:hypothetical protein|nr:hypothetical protein [Flavobacteriaceae bacterium]|tara:strand:- start:2912 stop:3166 length:255 start_codon:yes stop_codon:yes gene_type:complete
MSGDVWRPKAGILCKVVFRGHKTPETQRGFIIRQTTRQDTYTTGDGQRRTMSGIDVGDVWQVLTDDGNVYHYHQMHLREFEDEK